MQARKRERRLKGVGSVAVCLEAERGMKRRRVKGYSCEMRIRINLIKTRRAPRLCPGQQGVSSKTETCAMFIPRTHTHKHTQIDSPQ